MGGGWWARAFRVAVTAHPLVFVFTTRMLVSGLFSDSWECLGGAEGPEKSRCAVDFSLVPAFMFANLFS